MKQRCLYCYKALPEGTIDFHPACSRKLFGSPVPPILDYDSGQMEELARQVVIRSIAVTGVQPKLSLDIEKIPGDPALSRLTIVGLWGHYILKPPTAEYPNMPENEDVTMHLAAHFGISTAGHSLLRLKSGELAYITKRFDRIKRKKLAVEDMCQLTETLTEDKYKGSMEKVGKCIAAFATAPGLDALRFFETAFFCFLTGNADMHLKNFSLLTTSKGVVSLSPAYDLLCTKILLPEDLEEMALTMNAKKRKIKKADFDVLAASLRIPPSALAQCYTRFSKKIKDALWWLDNSFLPERLKAAYGDLLVENAAKLSL